MQEQLRAKHHI